MLCRSSVTRDSPPSSRTSPPSSEVRMTASFGNAKLASCSCTVKVASEPTVTAKRRCPRRRSTVRNAAASVCATAGVAPSVIPGVGVWTGAAVGVAVGSSPPQEAAKSSMTSSKVEMDLLAREIGNGMTEPPSVSCSATGPGRCRRGPLAAAPGARFRRRPCLRGPRRGRRPIRLRLRLRPIASRRPVARDTG